MARANVYLPDDQLRLVDALYVEPALSLGVPLITTDPRLHAMPAAEVVRA